MSENLEKQFLPLDAPSHELYHPMLALVMTRRSLKKEDGSRAFIPPARLRHFGFNVEEREVDGELRAYTPREFEAQVLVSYGPHNILDPKIVESEIFESLPQRVRNTMRRPSFQLIEITDNAAPEDAEDPGSLLPLTGEKVKNWKGEETVAYYACSTEKASLQLHDLLRAANSRNVGARTPTPRGPRLDTQLFTVGTITETSDRGGFHQVTHVLFIPSTPRNPNTGFRGYLFGLGACDMLEQFYLLQRISWDWQWSAGQNARTLELTESQEEDDEVETDATGAPVEEHSETAATDASA